MITISIEITPTEKARLLNYCEGVHDSGHWGDGAVELPDEKILAEKIQAAGDSLDLTLRDVEILKIHIEDSTDHGFVLLPEDQSILLKLVEALEHGLRTQLAVVDHFEEVLQSVTGIVPANRPWSDKERETAGMIEGGPETAPEAHQAVDSAQDAAAHEAPRRREAPSSAIQPQLERESIFTRLRKMIAGTRPELSVPDINTRANPAEGELTLDERIKRAKAAAKRLGKMR